MYAESLHYAQLRPERVESNHFAYHLEQLVKTKFVDKKGKAYCLAPEGLAYVDRMSQAKMIERLQPHIVTAIDLTTSDGKTLLFKRNFQPYIHQVGLPLGKLHYTEQVEQAAVRELEEKTGIKDIGLQHRGVVYIQASMKRVVIGRVLYHVFHADVSQALPTVTPEDRGETYWANHRSLQESELMPGFLRIKELLAGNPDELFFDEIQINLKS